MSTLKELIVQQQQKISELKQLDDDRPIETQVLIQLEIRKLNAFKKRHQLLVDKRMANCHRFNRFLITLIICVPLTSGLLSYKYQNGYIIATGFFLFVILLFSAMIGGVIYENKIEHQVGELELDSEQGGLLEFT